MTQHLFHKEIYVYRRRQLAGSIGSGLILLPGNEDSPMNYADNCYPFRQDSTFLYYFGLDTQGLAATIDADTGEAVLYGKEASMDDIIWTGPLPSLQDMASAVGLVVSRPYRQLESRLQQAKRSGQTIHFLPPYRAANKLRLAEWLGMPLASLAQQASIALIKTVVAQRECKEACEMVEIEEAVSISAEMHLAALVTAMPGMREYEVAARVEEVALAANGRLSYPIILTTNGQTLHNHYHGNRISDGQMLLMDAGAENKMHYAGDLTRTFPAGKTFSARQKEMYNIVLDALNVAVQLAETGHFVQGSAYASLHPTDGRIESSEPCKGRCCRSCCRRCAHAVFSMRAWTYDGAGCARHGRPWRGIRGL